jgi:hypothetical protein
MGLRAAATGVKFRPGSPSTLGEKVDSGLVWRFSTLDCVSDNLACFKDGFSDSGFFLDVGGHRFYIAKPFPEEVIDVLDPLYDAGSDYGESGDFFPMVEVLALEEDVVAATYRAPRARRSNAHLHRSKIFHLQSGTFWMLPSQTCARRSTSPPI